MEASIKYPAEEWRQVPGFPDYEISSWGKLRSYKKGKCILKKPSAQRGYLLTILRKNGKSYQTRIHVLVALAFIGPRPPKYHIHHLDGNSMNNHFRNIAYIAVSDHLSHHANRLSPAEKEEVRHLYMNHIDDLDKLAELIGVNRWIIERCIADLREGMR